MRYALIALWMIGFVCLVAGLSEPPASAQNPANSVVVKTDPTGTHLTVVGPFRTSSHEAWQAALERAQEEVFNQLQGDGIAPNSSTPALIRSQFLQSKKEEVKDLGAPVGTMRRFLLEITISPQQRNQLIAEQRALEQQERVRERMKMAGIIMAGLVVVLGAIAGYLRLDDLTKGFYTGWLRLAGVGLVLLVLAGLFGWMASSRPDNVPAMFQGKVLPPDKH